MSKLYKNKKELINDLIKEDQIVLDVGFWGQGISVDDNNWVHKLLKNKAKVVYGLDLYFDLERLDNKENYKLASAEDFDFENKFDVIFAGDIIEHLSNPGLFLDSCARNLKPDGRLIITTPNCFGFFNLTEKISKSEPTVNKDHTCYFNQKTLSVLLSKNNWQTKEVCWLYSLGSKYKQSLKKKFLNIIYSFVNKFTTKFSVGLVIIAQKE